MKKVTSPETLLTPTKISRSGLFCTGLRGYITLILGLVSAGVSKRTNEGEDQSVLSPKRPARKEPERAVPGVYGGEGTAVRRNLG